ncbi:MAG: glycosyltransferase family 2 protein [Lentisphaeria bacterium]|nr:glycosyltransferase family 2 protein [Lentisphaeria bacterium]
MPIELQACRHTRVNQPPPKALEAAPCIVLPLYANRTTAPVLCARLLHAMGAGNPFRIVGVDDCGNDGSAAALREAAADAGIPCRIARHERNRGQAAAIRTGLRLAQGSDTVVMDADLQDPPEVVPLLLAALAGEGRGLAFARRRAEQRSRATRTMALLFRALVFRIMDAKVPADVGLFFAVSRSTLDQLLSLPIREDLLLAALFALDVPAATVDYSRAGPPPRGSGYSLRTRAVLACRTLGRAVQVRRCLPVIRGQHRPPQPGAPGTH